MSEEEKIYKQTCYECGTIFVCKAKPPPKPKSCRTICVLCYNRGIDSGLIFETLEDAVENLNPCKEKK